MVTAMNNAEIQNETVPLTENQLRELFTRHFRAFVVGVRIEGKNVLVEFAGHAPRDVGQTGNRS